MKRIYKIDEEIVSRYMSAHKMAESSIVGEQPDSFLVQNGKKMSPLSKNAVEDWAIDNGLVEGLGAGKGSPVHHTMDKRHEEIKAGITPETEAAYQAQTRDGRFAAGKASAEANAQPSEQPWKGSKQYPKSGGTNQ